MTTRGPAVVTLACCAAVALSACVSTDRAGETEEPCFILVADDTFTDAPTEPTPVAALQAAVSSGDLAELSDEDVDVLVEQLDGLPAGDTPIFVGVEGTTVTLSPVDDAWQVTARQTVEDC